MKSTARERRRIQAHFRRLIAARLTKFPKAREPLDAPDRHGVYCIVHARRGVLHVGRTVTGKRGLYQRLKNHLQGRSSFAIKFSRPRKLNLRSTCSFRYLKLAHPRSRALLEAYAVGRLCPAYLGDGTGAG